MKPPFLKAIDFSEEDFKSSPLLELRIHVIKECNLRCIYCLSDAPFADEEVERGKRLSLEEIKDNIRQAKELGIKVVSITGSGEPLLYKDLRNLIEFIKELNLGVVLFTNSLLLTEELAEWLNEKKVNLMIKLNSFNCEVNDKLVGLRGAQKIFLDKIKMLVDIGFAKDKRLALNCIICKENYNEISDIFIFCRENMIIPWIETVTITGRATANMKLPREMIRDLYIKLSKIDRKRFGFEWLPDSPIVGADLRRYRYVAQIDIYGNVYHTDANITDGVGNIRNNKLYDLITSDKFIQLRDSDKHSHHFLENDNLVLAEKIYKILVNRKFRSGPVPSEESKIFILDKIKSNIACNSPIKLFQFWGGCKNPNLPTDDAELCEKAAIDNLKKLSDEVSVIYKPGLKFYISPGDGRVQQVNRVPKIKTQKYVETLTKIAEGYSGIFTVVPISTLYEKYHNEFNYCLEKAIQDFTNDIYQQPGFSKLVANARKNIFIGDIQNENKIIEESREAAKDYVIYRVAEEEALIFREFDDCIRSFFIKYAPFYKKYIKDISKTKPRLDHSLIFYTGRKGNITQPWQAIGQENEGEVLFLSQGRL